MFLQMFSIGLGDRAFAAAAPKLWNTIPLSIMHMSSACPWGRTPGQPGEYVGEYKGMNWLLCPWAGENSRHCFEFEGKGWGNSKFCKITDANHGDIRGICRFPQPINTGNIKGAKRSETENTRFRAA